MLFPGTKPISRASGGLRQPRAKARGKSGLHETRVAGNARRRAFGGARESATESKPPMAPRKRGAQARVKGCGKSAPGRWQQGPHGKPHPEQGRIGVSCRKAGGFRAERPGLAARAVEQSPAQMNGCHPGAGPQGYRPGRQNPAYDGPLICLFSERPSGRSSSLDVLRFAADPLRLARVRSRSVRSRTETSPILSYGHGPGRAATARPSGRAAGAPARSVGNSTEDVPAEAGTQTNYARPTLT